MCVPEWPLMRRACPLVRAPSASELTRHTSTGVSAEVTKPRLKAVKLAEGLKATDRTGATRMVGFGEIGRHAES